MVDEINEILISLAKRKETITYGDLAKSLKSKKVKPYYKTFTKALGEVSKKSFREHKITLSSLVRNKKGVCGEGYKNLCEVICSPSNQEEEKMKVFLHYCKR